MGQAITQAIDLYFLDECGFAPTLPTTYTWARRGVRVTVPYVAPQGRRVNVIGALAPYGPQPRLAYHSRCGKIDGAAFVEFLWRDVAHLPAAPQKLPATYRRERPCVIVLDNYSVHRSAVVKDLLPTLQAAGVTIFYLPPYSPELNAIEHLWRHIKHEDLPLRSFAEAEALKAAVDGVLDTHVAQLAQSTISLCEAA
ncbi:MAG: transposase [Ktedonobacterales bacterium]